MSALFVFLVNSTREKKKVSVEGEEGNKKNEEKRRAKRPSSSSFSAAKSNNNGTITLHARATRRREKKWQREREISLSNGDAASLFFPKEEPFFPRGGCARSLPHALLLLKVNGGTIEKKENKDVLKQTHT